MSSDITVTMACQLVLKEEPPSRAFPMAHQDTPLRALRELASDGPYILSTDDAGHIMGLVPSGHILDRLERRNEQERARWAEMPLSSLVRVVLPGDTQCHATPVQKTHEGSAITENGQLLGIAAFDDIFLSWRRVSSVVSNASLDPLTGLMNRMAYERRIHEEWDRARRVGFSVGVIMIDLDNFKEVNDGYGHEEGDRVIRWVASSLEASLRSYDVLARYGGDEFVALCVGCRPGEILIPMTRMLESLKDSSIPRSCSEKKMSASMGAAVCHDCFNETNPVEMLAQADRNLYRAKTTGGTACWVEHQSGSSVEYGPGSQEQPLTFDHLPTANTYGAMRNS